MIRLIGDTHGDLYKLQLACKGLSSEDSVIVLGDFGFIWSDSNLERRNLKLINHLEPTVMFLPGNHENFSLLGEYEESSSPIGKVKKIRSKLWMLQTGHCYKIEKKKFFVVGGATSIDKAQRREGISWWKEEEPSFADYEKAFETIDANHGEFDYLLSHTTHPAAIKRMFPNYFASGSQKIKSGVEDFLENLFLLPGEGAVDRIKFRANCFGHFHVDHYFRIKDYAFAGLSSLALDIAGYGLSETDYHTKYGFSDEEMLTH